MEDTDWRPSKCPECGAWREAARNPICEPCAENQPPDEEDTPMSETDQQAPERIWITGTSKCGAWNVKPNPNPSLHEHEKAYACLDLLEAAENRIAELDRQLYNMTEAAKDRAADVERLTAERDEAVSRCDSLNEKLGQWMARAGKAEFQFASERDQALAASAAREIAMRERAAKTVQDWWEKGTLSAYRLPQDYIRALPINPDATAALNEMLADAWDDGHRNYLSGANPYRKDSQK